MEPTSHDFSKNNIGVDIDALFEDESAFTPLTDGLGFHQEKVESKRPDIKKQSEVLRKAFVTEAKEMKKPHGKHMGELSAFYSEPLKTDILVETKENPTKKSPMKLAHASLSKRSFAFIFDFTFVSALFVSFSFLVSYLANLELAIFRLLPLETLLLTTIPIFSLIYLFYFSIFDKNQVSTFGKRIFNLKTMRNNKFELSLLLSISRSCLSLVSIFLLGLPLFLDFHGKLTETAVFENA